VAREVVIAASSAAWRRASAEATRRGNGEREQVQPRQLA